MTKRALYRISAGLIALFDIGHSVGCPWSDPKWGDAPAAMRSGHFEVFGFSRTYWDFYVGFGLFNSVFLLLAAILAWQLGSVPAQAWPLLRATAWALALCFAALTVLSWLYFFTIPIAFSGVITACLVVAAWRSPRAA